MTPATSPKKCSRHRCHAPDIQCAEGHDDIGTCPHWNGAHPHTRGPSGEETVPTPDSVDTANIGTTAGEGGSVTLSWSGGALGGDDLAVVAAHRRPRVIALIGPQNAGKTTFLALLYLLVRRGVRFASGRFAGSYSLGGWEKLARYLTWEGDCEPTFPPHTAANEGRRPGLLHLAFRGEDQRRTDTLWTDAPGEWFRLWAVNGEAPNAEGARWTQRHADRFLVFADSEALAGRARGEAVDNIRLLIERLRIGIGDRPVALVWAKSDVVPHVPAPIREQIEGDLRRHFRQQEIFAVSVPKADPNDETEADSIAEFVRALDWALAPRQRQSEPIVLPVLKEDDPLFAFRGRA